MLLSTLVMAAGVATARPAAPVLETDTFAAAMRCGIATTIAGADTGTTLELSAQLTYYMIIAQRANPGTTKFFDRLNELSAQAANDPIPKPDALVLAPLCARRFARPAVTPAGKLPKDPFQRDVMCMGVTSIMLGAAQEFDKANGGQTAARVKAVVDPVIARLDDKALKARGYTEDTLLVELGKQITRSIALGDPLAVSRACGVTGI